MKLLNIANLIKKFLLDNGFNSLYIYVNTYPEREDLNYILINHEQDLVDTILKKCESHFQIFIHHKNHNEVNNILNVLLNLLKNDYEKLLNDEDNLNIHQIQGLIIKNINYLGRDSKNYYEASMNFFLIYEL
jgi:hypothetical protein